MKHRFQYHAFATGVAAQITHPFEHLIEAQAPSALSPMGGYSSNRVEYFRFKEILSFRAAYTQVAGTFVDKSGNQSWDTVMTSTVEGLNIMGVVTADRIVARLASRHGIHDQEPSILPLGSHIEGLRIAGIPIHIKWSVDRYCHMDTYAKVVDGYRTNKDGFSEKFDQENRVGQHESLPEFLRSFFPGSHHRAKEAITDDNRTIATSLVANLDVESDCLKTHGHTIHVPQFGNVVIGQLLIDGNARQITMLQVYPECAVGIACAAGSGQTNGKPVPPVPPAPL